MNETPNNRDFEEWYRDADEDDNLTVNYNKYEGARQAWNAAILSQEKEKRSYESDVIKLTATMEEHPDWWEHGCECSTCLSYADNDRDD